MKVMGKNIMECQMGPIEWAGYPLEILIIIVEKMERLYMESKK